MTTRELHSELVALVSDLIGTGDPTLCQRATGALNLLLDEYAGNN